MTKCPLPWGRGKGEGENLKDSHTFRCRPLRLFFLGVSFRVDDRGYSCTPVYNETGANDVTGSRLYDGVARMTRLTWSQTGNTLPDFSYDFDKAANILTKTHEHRSSDKAEAYDVDGLYRLTDARYDFRTLTHSFDYDDLGNQLTFTYNATAITYLHNDANEVTKVNATQAHYDKNGNLKAIGTEGDRRI